MSLPADLIREYPGLGEWAIVVGYRGSIAHGTYLDPSDPASVDDKDAMAVCVPPLDHYFGLRDFGSRGTQEIKRDPWDVVVYEARKAIRMLAQGNPNTLSLLWLPENLYVRRTDAGRLLLNERDAFVGRHVYRSFVGYATSQLRKMEQGVYRGFMGDKRRALVDEHGFDTKNAAHLVRILRQGIEFLRDGELYVQRHDAAQLVGIRRGEWSLERVKDEAERLFANAEQAYLTSSLPVRPDMDRVNDLAAEVVDVALRERGALT